MLDRAPLPTLAALFVAAAWPSFAQERWAEHVDSRGTHVEYPASIFSDRKGSEGGGPVYVTRDGRARLHIFSMENPQRAFTP